MADKFTPKQQRFVEEYLIDLNATQAAVRAGYSKKTAEQSASRLLRNVKVEAAIKSAQAARSERTEITQDQVLTELAKLGFSNMMDYMTPQSDGTAIVDLSELTRDQAAALTEVQVDSYLDNQERDEDDNPRPVKKVKIKLADKRAPLVDIGKHLGMFPSKVEHTGKDGGPIETKDLTDQEFARRLAFVLTKGAQASDDGNS